MSGKLGRLGENVRRQLLYRSHGGDIKPIMFYGNRDDEADLEFSNFRWAGQ
jgi:hypothetical protein